MVPERPLDSATCGRSGSAAKIDLSGVASRPKRHASTVDGGSHQSLAYPFSVFAPAAGEASPIFSVFSGGKVHNFKFSYDVFDFKNQY